MLCILDPADELVAGEGRDVVPRSERRRIGEQRLAQICGKLVYDPAGHALAAHETSRAVTKGIAAELKTATAGSYHRGADVVILAVVKAAAFDTGKRNTRRGDAVG